jgi:FkbM family methyltransferase
LRPGGCFYDVGAHIGFYSLLAARLVGEEGCVVAFEPDPTNVAVLHENLSRNDLTEVDVIPVAVWNHSGHVTFQRSAAESPEVSSRRGTVVGSNGEAPGSGRIKVEAVSLDEFARDHRLPTMIKIDVEGAEAEALQGAGSLIAQTRPILLVEVHHQPAATFLENQLRQGNYKMEWLARHPKFPFPRHLLARPRCEFYPG